MSIIKKYKIVALSDSPFSPTGYATITKNLMRYLQKSGKFEPHILGHNYFGQTIQQCVLDDGEKLNVPVHGAAFAHHGLDKIQPLIREVKADIFFTLLDTFMLIENPPNAFMNVDFAPAKSIFYFPSDGHDCLPERMDMQGIRCLEKVDLPVAMSKFAQRQAKEVYGLQTDYIPHAIDPFTYFPLLPEEKFRNRMSFIVYDCVGNQFRIPPEAFVIGSVYRNQPRKMPDRTILMIKLMQDLYMGNLKDVEPEWHYLKDLEIIKDFNKILFVHHCDPWDPAQINTMQDMLRLHKIPHKVFFTGMRINDMYPISKMNQVYNLFDLYLSTTSGEGFGVCTIEAMACEVPCVITAGTTTEELLLEDGKCGTPLPTIGNYNNPIGGWMTRRMMNDVYKSLPILNEYYVNEKKRKEEGKVGREKVLKYYDWEKVAKLWEERLIRLMENP